MLRETSIDAYHEIKQSGILGKIQFKVYETLYHKGPLTANELRKEISNNGNSGVYGTRLSELEKMGAIKTIKKRKCRVSGRNGLVWAVTSKVPQVKLKRVTKAEKIQKINQKIELFQNEIRSPRYIRKQEVIQILDIIKIKLKEL